MPRWIGCGIGIVLAFLAGCNKRGEEAKTPAKPLVEVKKDNNGKAIPAQPVSLGKAPNPPSWPGRWINWATSPSSSAPCA